MVNQKIPFGKEIDSIDLPTATFTKLEGDVIWVRYKPFEEEFGLEEAKNHTAALHSLDQGIPKHIVIDFRGVDVQFTNEARDYFAKAQAHEEMRKSQALVIDSLAHKLVANFYMRSNKPTCPVAIFENPKEAWDWVQSLT